jgi:beta-galactosidase
MCFTVNAVIDTSSQHFYMFTYFIQGPEEQAAGARLAFSTDGVTWEKYNNEKPVIIPASFTAAGERPLMRDPNIYFDSTTGVFHMTWTTGWLQKNVGYATSKDLIRWSDQVKIPLGGRIKNSTCCLAPEFFYDDIKDSVMIIWSTERNLDGKEAFCSYTKDFRSYTYPEVYFEGRTKAGTRYSVTDQTILKVADKKYYLFYMDDRPNDGTVPIGVQLIHCTIGVTPKYPWWKGPGEYESGSDGITGLYYSGPTAYIIGDEVRLVAEPFKNHTSVNRVFTTKLSELGYDPPLKWSNGPTMKTSSGDSFLPGHGSISEIPRAKMIQVFYNIPDRTKYPKSWTDIKQSEIIVSDYPESTKEVLPLSPKKVNVTNIVSNGSGLLSVNFTADRPAQASFTLYTTNGRRLGKAYSTILHPGKNPILLSSMVELSGFQTKILNVSLVNSSTTQWIILSH